MSTAIAVMSPADHAVVVTGKLGEGQERVEWEFTPTTPGRCSRVARIYGSDGSLLATVPDGGPVAGYPEHTAHGDREMVHNHLDVPATVAGLACMDLFPGTRTIASRTA